MAATKMDSGPEWEITDHAVERRLEAEGASLGQIWQTLEYDSERVKQEIAREMQSAVMLSIQIRRLFIDPGREAYLGRRYSWSRNFARGRRAPHAWPKRRGRGDYFYTGHVVYVANGRSIVTTIIPNANQAETLAEWVDVPQVGSLTCLAPKIETVLSDYSASLRENFSRISVIRSRLPLSTRAFRSAERLPIAKWLTKPGAYWTLLVAHEQDGRTTLRDMLRMVRTLMPGQRPSVYVERALDLPQLIPSPVDPDHPTCLRLIPFVGINCSYIVREKPGTYLRRWWKRIQELSPPGGRLIMVVSPDTARMVLELSDSQNRTEWCERVGLFSPGSVISLSWNIRPKGHSITLQNRRF